MEKEFVVYQSKTRQTGFAILAVLMVILSVVLLLEGLTLTNYLWLGLGIIGVVVFVACGVYIFRQLAFGKQLVVLTPKGFYDRSSALSNKEQLVPWTNVEKIEEVGMATQLFVSVYLKDPEPFFHSMSSMQKKTVKSNQSMGLGEVNLSLQSAKDCTNEELIRQMNRYWKAAR